MMGLPIPAERWPSCRSAGLSRPAALERQRGTFRSCASWLILAVALAATPPAPAEDARPPAKGDAPRGDAAAFLARIQDAALHQNYAGTFVYQDGAAMRSSRITHLVEGGSEFEKLEVLDGAVQEFTREGDEVHWYLPQRKLLIIEAHATSDKFPALLTAPPQDIDTFYALTHQDNERVAGHACSVATLTPQDDLRYGYKLWSDLETGLLLKAQTLDQEQHVVEQVTFTDVTIGQKIDRSRVKPSVTSTDGWQVETYGSQPANLVRQGWKVEGQPAGFRRIEEARRTLKDGREVGQIVISDGLAAISVFIERAVDPTAPAVETHKGLMNFATARHGEYLLTVVGEVPAKTVRQVADSVEFRPGK